MNILFIEKSYVHADLDIPGSASSSSRSGHARAIASARLLAYITLDMFAGVCCLPLGRVDREEVSLHFTVLLLVPVLGSKNRPVADTQSI